MKIIQNNSLSSKQNFAIPFSLSRCRDQPTYISSCKLWLYGNIDLLEGNLATPGSLFDYSGSYDAQLEAIEIESQEIVLSGQILVCGIHNHQHQRAAVVPLRWGAPRIIVMSGGIRHHLGPNLSEEPFRTARLWRYQWDHRSDLAISRRSPEKPPSFSLCLPTIDRLVHSIVLGSVEGLLDFAQPPLLFA